VHFQSLRA